MSLYQKLRFENASNSENLEKIETAAGKAVEYAAQYYEYAVSNSYLNEDGILQLTFVPGQDIDSPAAIHGEAQQNFEEKFSELINEEYPEVK